MYMLYMCYVCYNTTMSYTFMFFTQKYTPCIQFMHRARAAVAIALAAEITLSPSGGVHGVCALERPSQ